MTVYLPKSLVHDFDAKQLTESLTPTLDALKQHISQALSPAPAPAPELSSAQPIRTPEAATMTAPPEPPPLEAPQFVAPQLPSVDEIMGRGASDGPGALVGGEGDRGVRRDDGGLGGTLAETGSTGSSGAEGGGQDQGDTQPISFQLPSVEQIMGRFAPEKPTPTPAMGAQPITGSESVPSGATAPVQRGPVDTAPQDIEGYIRYAAQKRGIDPNVAVAVADSEGGLKDPVRVGDPNRGGSYGPFQLNYLPGSVGDRFTKATGMHASDPTAWKAGVDYALDEAAQKGWGQWFGAARAGIANSAGLQNARPIGVEAGPEVASPSDARPTASAAGDGAIPTADASATGSTDRRFSELTPNQFTAGATLTSADANAACGPAAAVAFARRNGRNPTLDEAVSLAKEVGWNTTQGMQGPQSEVALLNKMGIAATLTGVNEKKIADDVQRGNPVILDTPGHYFVAERYDPESGKFDFGNSAGILKAAAHQTWFTLQEAASLGMGAFRAAIHMDNPESPTPSVVAGKSAAIEPERAPELVQAVDTATGMQRADVTPDPTNQWSLLAQGFSKNAQSLAANEPKGYSGALTDPAQRSSLMAYEDDSAPAPIIEPGDFAMPSTAAPASSVQPSDAVEPAPAGVSPPEAPASLGDQIKGVFSELGNRLGDLLGGKPDYQQATQDIQQRQATVPGTARADELAQEPMPLQPVADVAQGAAGVWQGAKNVAASEGEKVGRLTQLNAKKLAQGLSVDETEEAKQLSIELSQYAVPGAPMELRGVAPEVRAGVEGRLPEQVAARRLESAPAAGIVSAEDAGRATTMQARSQIQQAPDEILQADRYYHGTGSDFTRPDAGKFDPNGLFGPGYYLTDEPRVAGTGSPDINRSGYAEIRSRVGTNEDAISRYEAQLADAESKLADLRSRPNADPFEVDFQETRSRSLRGLIDRLEVEQGTGPNVRPVDVPRDLRLLDADAPIGTLQAARIREQVGGAVPIRPDMTGEQVYGAIARTDPTLQGVPVNVATSPGLDRTHATDVLRQAGYDGIRYAGGKRIPMTDEAGNAIEHQAVVIFPESLDKITNVTAGTPGGLIPGAQNIGAGVARGATQGAVAGGYEASQQEGAGPLDVAQGALMGGAEGAVLGGARRAIGPRGAGNIARVIPKTNADAWDAVTETIRADAPDPFPERVVNWARKLPDDAVRNMFDATVPLRQATEAAQKAIGRKLRPDENAWLLARLLPGVSRRADLIARDALGPAVRGLDDAGYEQLNGYLAALDAVDKSKAMGNPNRKFGSFTGAEAQQAVDHLRTTLPRNELADLDSRVAMVRDHVNAMRDRMTESGLSSQDMTNEFRQQYPNYSPIRYTDWMDEAERSQGTAASLSVRENGIKRLTEHGASYGRQAPTEALLEATHDVERRAAKNEAAQAFVQYAKVDPIAEQLTRPANEAAASYLGKPLAEKRRPNETTFTMWDDGVKHEFYIDKDLEGAFRQDQFQIPGIAGAAVRAASSAFRAGATGSNVLFLIPNAIGDALTATIRGEFPASLIRGYRQAFTHGPEYEAAIKAGIGYSGFVESGGAAKTMRELRGSLNTLDQLKEYASWANPLKIAQDIGERVEMAPRVGMYGQKIREGAAPEEAALAGRDVTMDFARAGLWSRAMNQLVPFFNVGMQAPAQVARFLAKAAPGELKPSQAEALARVSGMVVAPVIGLEVYNRTHPEYEDVPQYDKDRGLIIMDPRGPGPENPDTGRPTPRYTIVGLREWTPYAIVTRAAMEGKLKPEDWGELAFRMSQYSSPVSLSEGVQSIVPPWLSVPIEMKANYDAFRQRPIVPDSLKDRLPEEQYTSATSETSKLIGRALQKPPAMIEHAIRGLGTGVAGQVLSASDTALRAVGAAPAREDTGLVKDLPVVGGLAGRFYREQGGELNNRSRQENDAQFASIMRDAGLRGDEISRPGWKIGDTRLNAAEKAEYDELFNDYLDRELSVALNRSGDPAELARAAAAKARQAASARILQSISGPERSYRRQEERAKVAS